MKGLLKKDFLTLYKTWPALLLVFAAVTLMLVYFGAESGILSFVTIYFVMQGVSSLITDKMGGWYSYQTTLPVSRANALREKYILSLLCGLAGFVLGFAITMLITGGLDQESLEISMLIGIVLSLSAAAFGIPMLAVLPKNSFIISIFGSLLPGAIVVGIWSQKISEASAAMAESAMAVTESGAMEVAGAAAEFSMYLEILWWGLAIMAILFVLSYIIAPVLVAKTDQN